jgi:hypothetical protein
MNRILIIFLLFTLGVSSCTKTKLERKQSRVQKKLDKGQTPLDIYNSGFELEEIYGTKYEGGIIFYLDVETGEGMVFSEQVYDDVVWDTNSVEYGVTSDLLNAGPLNTTALAALSSESLAAFMEDLVYNGYDDWFLMSMDEAELLLEAVNDVTPTYFENKIFWTSSESGSGGFAWTVEFYSGYSSSGHIVGYLSDNEYSAVPVRKF